MCAQHQPAELCKHNDTSILGAQLCSACLELGMTPDTSPEMSSCIVQHQPAELYEQYTTIEYSVAVNNIMPPAYVFIVDTSVAEDELKACVASLTQALTTLPEWTQVGSTQKLIDIYSFMLEPVWPRSRRP